MSFAPNNLYDYKKNTVFSKIALMPIALVQKNNEIVSRDECVIEFVAKEFESMIHKFRKASFKEMILTDKALYVIKSLSKNYKNKNYAQLCKQVYDYYEIPCTCSNCLSAKVLHYYVAKKLYQSIKKENRIFEINDIRKILKDYELSKDDLKSFMLDSKVSLKRYYENKPEIAKYLEKIGHKFC